MSWQRLNAPARLRVAPSRTARARGGARLRGPGWRLAAAMLALAVGGAARADDAYGLIGRAAPDFALHAAAGSNVRLSEHRGEVVVLSFWSSRCSPCRAQLEGLNRSLATYRQAGLAIFGVGVDDDPGQSRDFAHSMHVGFPLLLDPAKGVARSYDVDNLPMTVLIDRNGTVRYAVRDYNAAADGAYLQALRTLLNE